MSRRNRKAYGIFEYCEVRDANGNHCMREPNHGDDLGSYAPKGHLFPAPQPEGQPQQDGPIPLPKELANWHEDLCGERNGTEIRSRIVAEDVIPLIERIGRAEAALKQARAALTSINRLTSPGSRTFDDLMRDSGLACDLARAALAATQGPQ